MAVSQDLIHSDCLDWLRKQPDSSIHCCVTDPPYGLAILGKRWDYDVPAVELSRPPTSRF